MVSRFIDPVNYDFAHFCRRLADCIDSGEVVVKNVHNPFVIPTGDPVEITWRPEIEFVVLSDDTKTLFESCICH